MKFLTRAYILAQKKSVICTKNKLFKVHTEQDTYACSKTNFYVAED